MNYKSLCLFSRTQMYRGCKCTFAIQINMLTVYAKFVAYGDYKASKVS